MRLVRLDNAWRCRAVTAAAGTDALQQQINTLLVEQTEKSIAALQAVHWRTIWVLPASLAAIVMLIFGLFFREDREPKRAV